MGETVISLSNLHSSYILKKGGKSRSRWVRWKRARAYVYLVIYLFFFFNPELPIYNLHSPLVTISFLNLWVCFCFVDNFIDIFLKILHINDIIWYLSFSVWLASLSAVISRSSHVAANRPYSIHFNVRVIFHCVYVPHTL